VVEGVVVEGMVAAVAFDPIGGVVEAADEAGGALVAVGEFGTEHARPGTAAMRIAAQSIRRENIWGALRVGYTQPSTDH
jgi:hypothetical protein